MQEKLEQVLAKLKDINGRLSRRNRIIAIVSIVAIIGVAVVGALALNSGGSAPLFVDMAQSEANEVLGKLAEMGVAGATFSDGTLSVPADQVDELRARLAMQGYPKSGLSYEVFQGNVGMMATDFERETYKLYDLQNRIAATIGYFDGVERAVVTISSGNDNKYVLQKDKQEPSASVTVFMDGGGSPEAGQVQGMQRLVASAVPGMKTENVVVLDGAGNDVTQTGSDDGISGTARLKMALEQDIERSIQAKLIYLLTPIYGENKVRVTVNSNVDVKKKLQENITYTPSTEDNKGVMHSEQTSVDIVGEGTAQGGVVGTETNAEIPIYPNVTINGTEIYYADDNAFEYLVSQMKEQIQDDGGDILDLSVGVVLDGETLSRTEKEELRQLIAATAGIDQELAEEKVAIINAKFLEEADPVSGIIEMLKDNPNMKWLLIGIAGLLVAIIVAVILVLGKMRKKKQAETLEEQEREREREQEQEQEDAGLQEILNAPLEMKRTRETELKNQISEFSDLNPEIAAQLIKTWLKGGKNE